MGQSPSKNFWYSRRAMAVYTLALLVVSCVALLFDNGLFREAPLDSHAEIVAAQEGANLVRENPPNPAVEFVPEQNGISLAREIPPQPGPEPTAKLEPTEREHVTFGETVSELRSMNGLRPLRYEEQSADLARLSGIYGFALALFLELNLGRSEGEWRYDISLQNEPDRYGEGVIEVHKTLEGKVLIVGYVDEATVARVVDRSKPVGAVIVYHDPVREGLVPVAIPASRVVGWDYRAPHGFSEVELN